jgi:hypothetical protein
VISQIHAAARSISVVEDFLSLQDWRQRVRPSGDPDNDILETFTQFLRTTDQATFRLAVETACETETGTSVWARLLGVAAERTAIAADLLWPLVTRPEFLSMLGLRRDAVEYLAAVYLSRSFAERTDFETMAIAPDNFTDELSQNHVLTRFLSRVAESSLATQEMCELRQQLREDDLLRGNRPLLSIESTWGPADDITERFLVREGVNVELEPDQSIRAANRLLEDVLKPGQIPDTTEALCKLWRLTRTLVETIDAARELEAHPETLHAGWGAVSNAVEQIAKSSMYDPGAPDQPNLNTLSDLIDFLLRSPYPKPQDGQNNGMMAWGNWDVRVYASSSSMALAGRFGNQHPESLDRLKTCLSDKAPTVRLQVAGSLNGLWDVARERMWELVTQVAEQEDHSGVLGFFISEPLQCLAGADADRVEGLLSAILNRLPETDIGAEGAGTLIAWLFVKAKNRHALTWIDRWAGDLIRGDTYLWAMLSALRDAFFSGYRGGGNGEELAMRDRAQDALGRVVVAATAAMNTAAPILRDDVRPEAEHKVMRALYVAGERLLDQCCNQLYFGSGAFPPSGQADAPGLVDVSGKRRFLADYRAILDQIGQNGTARTIHHLIDLYAYLADAEPSAVFDAIAAILMGPALRNNYQFEALGADASVALIRRYLADYRVVFEDQDRRARLVCVLEVFSSVGLPEALKLLYELPDVLR